MASSLQQGGGGRGERRLVWVWVWVGGGEGVCVGCEVGWGAAEQGGQQQR